MARPRKKPLRFIVLAENLGCIDENRIFVPGSEPKKHLLDELQCPPADDVADRFRATNKIASGGRKPPDASRKSGGLRPPLAKKLQPLTQSILVDISQKSVR